MEGFARREGPDATLWARPDLLEELVEDGFTRSGRWLQALAEAPRAGRGQSASLAIRGRMVRFKQLRRGGLFARWLGDRFLLSKRLFDNLEIPRIARGRGVATPEPLALLVEPIAPFWKRGFLALAEVERARDLAQEIREGGLPSRELLEAAARALRQMHDSGIEHVDLNLGNLLVVRPVAAPVEVWVIDLDGARDRTGPLSVARRRRALRRVERSWHKLFPDQQGADSARRVLVDAYASGDLVLARGLGRFGRLWRLSLALHALSWSRRGR